jgi:photosystem II stability/assembly factor-like uncharacterized protein
MTRMKRACFVVLGLLVWSMGCRREDDGATPAFDDAGAQGDGGAGTTIVEDEEPELPAEPAVAPVTSGTATELTAVWMAPDKSLSIAVGLAGTVLVSRDEGRSWTAGPSGTTKDLTSVWGSSADDVWIGGADGTLSRSQSRGDSWEPVTTLKSTTRIRGIWGSSADQVFVAGASGDVFRTRDRGATFTSVRVRAGFALIGVSGFSANDVWTAAAVNIFQSRNAGDSFETIGANLFQQTGIRALAAEDVYTVNEGSVVTRFDGNTLFKHSFRKGKLLDVWGNSVNDVYVVGEGGLVMHSTDRSSRWAPVPGATGTLNAVGGTSTVLLAVGAGGVIFRR